MKGKNKKSAAIVAACMLLAPVNAPLLAQRPEAQPPLFTGSSVPSTGEIVGVAVGIAAIGAAIGIGVYFAIKHNHSVTGCAASTADGMTLTTESDKHTYSLIGDVAAIKPGNRVRVSGKKSKEKSAGRSQFMVE